MAKVYNRARMTTATNTSGTITLGAAVSKYQTFAAAGVANADIVHYTIEDGTAWEIGTGTYTTAGTTLSRTLVQSSTGSLLVLSGTAEVFITAPASSIQGGVDITGGTITGLSSPLPIASGGTNSTATATAGGAGYGTGTAHAYTAAGTSGQFLQSAGASAPVWSSATGRLLRAPQILTTGTSYTTPANCTAIYVECVGGGGGSGGALGATSVFVTSGGGGAGAYAAKLFTVAASTAYTYAIGAGGTAGAVTPTDGGIGGSTTFAVSATTVTAAGGGGSPLTSHNAIGVGGAGSGGSGTNGDVNVTGNSGSNGYSATLGARSAAGSGGGSFFGGGGLGKFGAAGVGTVGTSGGGAGGSMSNAATGNLGAVGGTGLIRVWEFV